MTWAAAGFLETGLSFLSSLELYRTDVPERRMTTRRVVEQFDVVEHVSTSPPHAAVHLPGRPLVFDELKKLSTPSCPRARPQASQALERAEAEVTELLLRPGLVRRFWHADLAAHIH